MKAHAYLPVVVDHLPAAFVFSADGSLRTDIDIYVKQGVVRVIAGPEECHLWIDVQRPYSRPSGLLNSPTFAAKA